MSSVQRVTVTVELDTGDSHTVIVSRPEPCGGNPRFLSQQIDTALADAGHRLGKIAETYASQVAR